MAPPMATTPLLTPFPTPLPKSNIVLILLLIVTTTITTTALFFLLTPPPPSILPHPVLILISFDGFRFGYQSKLPDLPNFRRLISNGTSADLGLIPVFPTLTFPNHYSIATGLFPVHHGIVNNYFLDPQNSKPFTTRSHEPQWWLGEPIWQTVASSSSSSAAVYFWPGGEVVKNAWTCPPKFCPKFDASVPFHERVDTVLGYFDLPPDKIPSFIALYFEDPDTQGHMFGPDHPEITDAVAHMDRILGRLASGLEKRGIFEEVNIILVGDHGMVGICEEKYIFLEDLGPWIEIPSTWVQSQYQLLAIRPPSTVSAKEVVDRMNKALSSGEVRNGDRLKVYLKEDLPERLHYSASDRVTPIVGLVEEGYTVVVRRGPEMKKCGGAHGYDNALFSMRSIFVGHGPRFEKGRKIPSFLNVELYNVMTAILKLKGAPNNGSDSFAGYVLLQDS